MVCHKVTSQQTGTLRLPVSWVGHALLGLVSLEMVYEIVVIIKKKELDAHHRLSYISLTVPLICRSALRSRAWVCNSKVREPTLRRARTRHYSRLANPSQYQHRFAEPKCQTHTSEQDRISKPYGSMLPVSDRQIINGISDSLILLGLIQKAPLIYYGPGLIDEFREAQLSL